MLLDFLLQRRGPAIPSRSRLAPPGALSSAPPQAAWWIATWAVCWRTPGLERRVEVRFSGRLRTSLGRCDVRKGRIRLAAWLADGPPDLLREVLCHEAAHLAVRLRFGTRCRPHGPQWRELMRLAGYAPRACFPESTLPLPLRRARAARVWEHYCPRCRTSTKACRRMHRWVCTACVRSGRSGRLRIRKARGR